VDNSVESFAPPDSPEIRALQDYRDTFGRADPFIILIKGDVFSVKFLERLKALHEAVSRINVKVAPPPRLAKQPKKKVEKSEFDFEGDSEGWGDEGAGTIMARVTSLINVRQTKSVPGGIDVRKLMSPLPDAADLPKLKAMVLKDRFLVGQVVGPKGRHAVLTAYTVDMYDGDIQKVTDDVLRVSEPLNGPGFEIYVTGPPAIAAQINQMVIEDLSRLMLYSVILLIIVLSWMFRHWIGLVGPIFVIFVSVVWTMAFMALVGFPLSILTSILPAFLFCVGVGDSIHMLSIYRERRKRGVENRQAIIQAVSITGPPVFYTSLTTMCGLFSLNFASVKVISEMGMAGGVGVIIAWIMSLVILPIILTLNPRSLLGADRSHSTDRTDRFIGWCVGWSRTRAGTRRHVRVLAVGLVIAVCATVGVTQLRVFHNDLDMLPDDATVKIAVMELDRNVGGGGTGELVITSRSGSLKKIEFLRGLDRVIADMLAYREPGTGQQLVTHALSIVDVAKETRRAFKGGQDAEYKLPVDQDEANDFLFVFENQSPAELSRLMTIDWTKTHVTFLVRWRDATAYKPLLDHIAQSVRTNLKGSVDMAGTGPVYVATRLITVMLRDLVVSFGTAFILVALLMVVMLREVKLGLIAMLPNLFPILIVMGVMGLTAIPLNLSTLLIASIALGIAVDDTVHFLHHFQSAYRMSGDCETAIEAAKHHAGKAMVTTSIILVTGFCVFCLSSNSAIAWLGLLTGITIAAALLTDLIILPAFLRWIYGDGPTATGTDTVIAASA